MKGSCCYCSGLKGVLVLLQTGVKGVLLLWQTRVKGVLVLFSGCRGWKNQLVNFINFTIPKNML